MREGKPTMKSTLRRGAAVTVTALVLGTGLAACGSSNTAGGTPVWPGVGGTVPTTSATGGASPSTPTPGSSVDPTDMSQTLQRAADAIHSAHMSMNISVMGQNVTAKGDVQEKPVAEDLTMQLMGMSVELRYVDSTIYLKLPSSAGIGDKWLKASAQELGSAAGVSDLGSLTDPLAIYTQIGGAIKGAKYVGTDSIGEHYSLQVDTQQMMKVMGVPSSELSAGALPSSLTEDIWLDSDGRVVQAKVNMGSAGSATVTMSNFGETVNVVAPPAGDVEDMSSLGGM